MAVKHFGFNIDAFADERVTGNFAASAHDGIFLDFDEGANFSFVADRTTVKVDEGE
jgi:hypothetical protein